MIFVSCTHYVDIGDNLGNVSCGLQVSDIRPNQNSLLVHGSIADIQTKTKISTIVSNTICSKANKSLEGYQLTIKDFTCINKDKFFYQDSICYISAEVFKNGIFLRTIASNNNARSYTATTAGVCELSCKSITEKLSEKFYDMSEFKVADNE
jgi:hypothetical protein